MPTQPKYYVTFQNGLRVRLSLGEINAIERMACMNGTSPEQVQYDPGHVRHTTVTNLVRKGVLRADQRKDGRLVYFVEGMLPVMGGTLYAKKPFTLAEFVKLEH